MLTALEAFPRLTLPCPRSVPARHNATAPSHRQRGRRKWHLAAAVRCREPLDSLVMRRSGRRPTRKACLSICLPSTRLMPNHIGMRLDKSRHGDRQPSSVLGREEAVCSRLTATLTATPAGTSGATWTISRSLTLRPDGGGCLGLSARTCGSSGSPWSRFLSSPRLRTAVRP
jgi:hypothetical protein